MIGPYNKFHRNDRSWEDFFLSTRSESTEFPSASPSKIVSVPTAAPSAFPTSEPLPQLPNHTNRNSAINNTLTILILLSIIFCFIWYVATSVQYQIQNKAITVYQHVHS